MKKFHLALLLSWISTAIAVVTPQQITTEKGLAAWVVTDQTTPLISISFLLRGGEDLDPLGQHGAAAMAVAMLAKGAGPYDKHAYIETLEDLNLSIAFSLQSNHVLGQITFPRDTKIQALEVAKHVLTQPRLPEKELREIKSKYLSIYGSLAKDEDFLSREGFRYLIGRQCLTAHIPTEDAIEKIDLSTLQQLLKKIFTQQDLILGISGNITPAEAAKLIDDLFAFLPKKATDISLCKGRPESESSIGFLNYASTQNTITFGHAVPIGLEHPDMLKFALLLHIFSDGMESRLFKTIREQAGLTYGIDVTWRTPYEMPSLEGYCTTERANVKKVISLIKNQWHLLKARGVTADELRRAKDHFKGSYPLGFINSPKIALTLVTYQKNKRPIDYFQRRNDLIEEITVDEINEVADKYIKPEALTFMIVGKQPENTQLGSPFFEIPFGQHQAYAINFQ